MKKLSLLFALLCASVMGWAYTSAPDTWIGTTDATYANQFKWSVLDGVATPNDVVNIQQPGFATAIGIYMNFADAGFDGVYMNGTLATNGTEYKQDGAGIVVYLSALTAKNTEVLIKQGSTTRFGLNIYNDKGSGGSTPDPGSDPDPTPVGINWGEISWLTNATGDAAYTEKYKAYAGDPGPSNIDVIQNPGWATAPGLYMTFPNADFRNFSLPASNYDLQGAGVIFHMNAFTAKETTVHVNVGGTVRSFTIYYEDGTEGPAEIYDINFALADNGSSATASTGTAANAIDGNNGTRWESASTDDETFTLDMGQKRIFNTIKINWEGAYCKEFELTYSNDGTNWSPLYAETNLTQAGWQTIELGSNVTAQYIKYHGTKRATGWGQSFFEFQVLLPGVSVLTSIDLTAPATIAQIGGAGVALTATPKDQNGQAMEAEISYEITPAAAGHMSGNTFIPDQVGSASIRAYSGEVYSQAVSIIGVPSANLALSTNIDTDNKIIAQSEFAPNGTNAFFAVDGNMGSVWQGSPTNGNVDDSREYDCWFVVDLGAFYNIDLVALHFEGACSELYHIDFSENNSTWNLGYNLVGAEGINARNDYWTDLDNNTKVRYVRFWSTKSATGWGMKLFEFEVYGTEWTSGDEEKPVMVSASLVSSTINSAVIAVSATDNDEVARYHVVDNVNGIDANFTPSDGKITITGLTHATDYNFTITAKDASNNESENSMVVAVSTPFDGSINLALNQPCEGGYYDNNPAESADKANDGNNGTSWVTYGDHAIALDWWVVDLGNVYNLTNITALWANDAYATQYILQARVDAPANEDKADDAAWVTLETVSGVTAGEERSTNVSGVGRYVRFRALAHTGFFRLREFRVYASGVAEVDTEAPVMSSASLVSAADNHAIIAVAATDNVGVAKFHVVDAVNNIDAEFVAEAGNITVTGLTGGTNYNFTITAIDFFGNVSANSKSVEVTTTAHYTDPQAACTAPTWDASLVKAMYSPTYNANYNHEDWGSGTVATEDEFGRKYVTNGNGYFGASGFSLNCLLMEKLHYDIWIENDATVRFVPIWGGTEQGITKSLVGQQWNSIDINLSEYTGITNWSNIYQMKIDQASNLTFWVANAYFYREAPYVDTEAPTNVSASKDAEGFYSVQITAQAEDNSGAVSFKVMNGEEVLATGAAATGVATTIMVNNLTPGTNYNFNVIAYDEANNEAEPVVVAAETKFMPAAAPAPDFGNKKVVAVFTDAMACAVSGIQSGGWGETTQVEWLDIAEGDKVFYGQNFNYAGWHSWAGGNIDATGMQFLHVDIYSTGMTAVNVTPISPGHEGSATINLTPNAWTSYDVPLSAYDANNIDWANIFQFKFMGPVGGNELMIDNVYFWSYQVTPNAAQGTDAGGWATFAAPIKLAVPAGLTAYKASYQKTETEEILNLTPIDVIPANTGVILKGTASEDFILTPTDAEASDVSDNALVGCVTRTDVSAVRETKDIFCMRYSASYDFTGFFLYEGQYVPANRAYLPLPKESNGPAAAARRVRFVINEEHVATGVENAKADSMEAVKFFENGQLFIRRGEAVYNLQGVRVK